LEAYASRLQLADFVVKVGFDLSDEDVSVFAGGQSGTF
jgi:hypothetical protein